jgi:hypothetical protein
MGATSYDEKKIDKLFAENENVYSEVKMDGRYLNVVITKDPKSQTPGSETKVFFESRGGKPNPLMGALEKEAMNFREAVGFDVVVNGELVLKDETNRYKANGIIASYVSIAQKEWDGKDITKEAEKFQEEHNMTLEEAKDRITLVTWDFLPLVDYNKAKYSKPRKERIKELQEILAATDSFQMIEYKVVTNKQEAIQHFQEMLHRGEEGTILKGENGTWKDGKPNWQIKMKLEITLDLKITGFNYGTPGTKNENVISSLNVESFDGKLKTSPGGITESMMDHITKNQDELLGTVVEVKCSGLSQDSNGEWACLHPVFNKLRDDKDTGDTLEDCIKIENMAKGLK